MHFIDKPDFDEIAATPSRTQTLITFAVTADHAGLPLPVSLDLADIDTTRASLRGMFWANRPADVDAWARYLHTSAEPDPYVHTCPGRREWQVYRVDTRWRGVDLHLWSAVDVDQTEACQ